MECPCQNKMQAQKIIQTTHKVLKEDVEFLLFLAKRNR